MMKRCEDGRLPPVSAAMILECVGLEVFRDQFGMRQCIERGVGTRRKKLGPAQVAPILFVPPLAEEAHELTLVEAVEIARDEARTVLARMCSACPFENCRMKSWGTATI